MSDEYLDMCNDLENLITNKKNISGNTFFEILKKYSSNISVFDMMTFSSQVIEENKYVQENYRQDSQKSYIESFLYRVKDIPKDTSDYSKNIDKQSLDSAITTLKVNHTDDATKNKNLLRISKS